jgi:hypothetical protein
MIWMLVVVAIVAAVLALVWVARRSRRRRRGSSVGDALSFINQWYDGVLDQQTTQRAAGADEQTIKQLIGEFDSSYDEGGLAAETLAKIGEPAVPYLIEAIQLKDGYKFAWGTVALEKMGRQAKAAIPILQKIANDPAQKQNRRTEALETIAKIRRG